MIKTKSVRASDFFGMILLLWMASLVNAQESSVLGEGRGIDEVIILVRDLEAAQDVYGNVLGFTLLPPKGSAYRLPSGLKISGAYFAENQLELRAIDDPEKAAENRPEYANFLEQHEGARSLVLAVSSLDATASFLRARGFEISEPIPGVFDGTTIWRIVTFTNSVLPGLPLVGQRPTGPGVRPDDEWLQRVATVWFVEYVDSQVDSREEWPPQHPNTARGIKSVWIGVRDLVTATKAYESVGLRSGQRQNLPQLEASGREIEAGRGVILLLEPQSEVGKVASFLAHRGEGIMGVSIEVRDLGTARKLIERNTGLEFAPYAGLYGNSILISAEIAHGLWIEMFQR